MDWNEAACGREPISSPELSKKRRTFIPDDSLPLHLTNIITYIEKAGCSHLKNVEGFLSLEGQ
jgi:hypothetical protein